MILGKVTLAEGSVGLVVIISMQYLLAWTARESKTLEKVINSSPTMVFYRGRFLESAMQKEVITHEEVYAENKEIQNA